MRTLFSTVGISPKLRFRRWCETINAQTVPVDHKQLGEKRFTATIEAASIGGLSVIRTSSGAVRSEVTPTLIRRLDRSDILLVVIKLGGASTQTQDDREAIQRAGDLILMEHRPTVFTSNLDNQALNIEIPRERLERMLGSARLYSALPIGADQASTKLATTFFNELVRVHEALDPDTAARMASIGVDLIVASIAERLARDVPKPLHGTVVVQRAKAHVEANLGDPTLDPPQLAAAVGVSLRRLQELFHERGRHVSDWIWQRRLETAAQRLADRGHAHLSIGMLAYGCGFTSQAHFARRFKDRYGISPSEHKQIASEKSTAAALIDARA